MGKGGRAEDRLVRRFYKLGYAYLMRVCIIFVL